MNDSQAAFGKGWAYPPAFNEQGVEMVQDLEDIHQSLIILFSTQPGERLLRQNYGCDLQSSIFENISEALIAELTTQITDSILRYETRIELNAVHIKQNPKQHSCLQIQVLYQLHGSKRLHQLNGQLDITDTGHLVFT